MTKWAVNFCFTNRPEPIVRLPSVPSAHGTLRSLPTPSSVSSRWTLFFFFPFQKRHFLRVAAGSPLCLPSFSFYSFAFLISWSYRYCTVFKEARSFNQSLANWNMSGVTNAKAMLSNARSFDSDVSGWDVAQIENPGGMFTSAIALSFGREILEKWDFSAATNIGYIFAYANPSFTGDLCTPSWLRTQSLPADKTTAAFTDVPAGVICCERGNYLVSEIGQKTTTSYCAPCETGKYQEQSMFDQVTSCKTCALGWAIMNGSATSMPCEKCVPGQYQDDSGDARTSWGCKICGTGKYSETGATTCTLCAAGQYQDLEGIGSCKACPEGFAQADTGKPFCLPCIKGEFQGQAGQSVCGQCEANEFSPNTKELSCTLCPAGQSSLAQSGACQQCTSGRFGAAAGAGCQDCTKGQFQKQAGQSECTPIEAGWYGVNGANTTKNSDQIKCPAGKSGAGGAAGCESCAVGKFTERASESVCENCPIGYTAASEGSTKCISCGVGTYGLSHNTCTSCPEGWHRSDEQTDYTTCVVCPRGRSSSYAGSSVCLDCGAGTFGAATDGTCSACPSGFYRGAEDNTTACTQCGKGFETPAAGAVSCAACESGKFGSASGVCTACPAGKYQELKGQSICTDCDVDTFLEKEGRRSKSDCVKCKLYAPHTTTAGVTGVSDKVQGCVCSGADKGATRGTEAYRGYYTLPAEEQTTAVEPSKKENNTKEEAAATHSVCAPCPTGADCSNTNSTLAQLTALPGFWRYDFDSNVFTDCARAFRSSPSPYQEAVKRCCPVDVETGLSVCLNSSSATPLDAQCADASRGLMCTECVDGYVKMGNECRECAGGASMGTGFAALTFMCGLITLMVLMCLGCGKGSSAMSKKNAAVFGHLKILIAFLQVLVSMPSVMSDISFPANFLSFTIPLLVFNFDFASIFSWTACGLAVPFLKQTVFHVVFLPMAVISVGLGNVLFNCLKRPKDHLVRSARRAKTSKILLLMILLMYTGLTTRMFTLFKCSSVEGIPGKILFEADWSVECYVGEHASMMIVGVVFLILYIFGIPLIMLFLLCKNKGSLHDTTHKNHSEISFALGGIYQQVCAVCLPRGFPFVAVVLLTDSLPAPTDPPTNHPHLFF